MKRPLAVLLISIGSLVCLPAMSSAATNAPVSASAFEFEPSDPEIVLGEVKVPQPYWGSDTLHVSVTVPDLAHAPVRATLKDAWARKLRHEQRASTKALKQVRGFMR